MNALRAELDAYKTAQGAAKDAAGTALGEKSAERYMENMGATPKYTQQSVGGQFDLDRVFEKDGVYYVLEAKAPNARPTPRLVPGTKDYAMEGSAQYLRDTLDAMAAPGKPAAVQSIAKELQDALSKEKVEYLMVTTRFSKNGGTPYFSVTTYNITGGSH